MPIKRDTFLKIIIAVIFFAGIFLRFYNFDEWLLFHADQARDAFFAKAAIEQGPDQLQLLGPKAGDHILLDGEEGEGKVLRLGPVYYYEQYLAGLFLGKAEPWVLALPDALFSVAAVVLFYILLRQGFKQTTSVLATLVFAVSYVLVLYSRFAWNVNQVVFWQLLLFLGLLRVVTERNRRYAGWWLIAVFLSVGILSQLHFIALFGFPLAVAIFFYFFPPRKIRLIFWIMAAAAVVLLYLPVLVSDLKNNGENIKLFFYNTQQQGKALAWDKKFFTMFDQQGRFYFFALTSFRKNEVPAAAGIGLGFIVVSVALMIWMLKRIHLNDAQEKNKKIILVFSLILLGVFSFIYLNLADKLGKPRYWLLSGALPFLMLAVGLDYLQGLARRKILLVFCVCFALFLAGLNIWGGMAFFQSLAKGEKANYWGRKIDLDEYGQLSMLGQMRRAAEWIVLHPQTQGKSICYFSTEYQHHQAYRYIFTYYQPGEKATLLDLKKVENSDCVYFLITDEDGRRRKEVQSLEKDFLLGDSFLEQPTIVFQLIPRNSRAITQ